MPYYPNAQRNRPPETQRNLPKYRFGIPPPLSLYEGYRGQSHMTFSSSTPTGDVWKTTNQARRWNPGSPKSGALSFLVVLPVGNHPPSNPGLTCTLSPPLDMPQVFSECAQFTNTVGLANQGISSDIARMLHKKQQR